jgi:hypothetical protein
MTAPNSYTEEIKVTGGKLLETVKNVVRAGQRAPRRDPQRVGAHRARRAAHGRRGGVVLMPFFAAVAGLAALAAHYTVVVERDAGTGLAPSARTD